MSGGTLRMANTVFYAFDPGKPRIYLDGVTVALNENNFVDDGSLPGAASGDLPMGAPPQETGRRGWPG